MATALEIVQKRYPQVIQVKDAKHPVIVEVEDADEKNAKIKNHRECAMALALKRTCKATGVMVSLKTAYIIKGRTAERFSVPISARTEIVSFDRKAGFTPGKYYLNPPAPAAKLGARAKRVEGLKEDRDHVGNGKLHRRFKEHKTANVRPRLA